MDALPKFGSEQEILLSLLEGIRTGTCSIHEPLASELVKADLLRPIPSGGVGVSLGVVGDAMLERLLVHQAAWERREAIEVRRLERENEYAGEEETLSSDLASYEKHTETLQRRENSGMRALADFRARKDP
ncbi:hypothetical protein [Xanthomonas campestris]|uniref:hypothetical protein n=1 Tax=Xanthomonas campestris TaxID=339 RepID=UPI003CF9F0D2